jgi:hypothetical protein
MIISEKKPKYVQVRVSYTSYTTANSSRQQIENANTGTIFVIKYITPEQVKSCKKKINIYMNTTPNKFTEE